MICSICGAMIGQNPIKTLKIVQNDDVAMTGGESAEELGGLFD